MKAESSSASSSRSSNILKALVTFVLLIALFSSADFLSLLKYVKEISVAGWLLCLALFIAQLGVATLRLWVILCKNSQKFPFLRILEIQSVSLLAGNLLLGNLGSSLARIGLLFRLGITWPSAVSSVLIDRICVIIGLVILTGATLPFVPLTLSGINFQLMPEFSTILLVSLGLVLLFGVLSTSEKVGKFLKKTLSQLWGEIRTYGSRRDILLVGLGLTVFSQLILFIAQYFVAWEIGIQVRFLDLLTILPAIALLATLPVSIGGWGVREGATVFGLFLFDIPFEKALLLSVIGGVLALLAVLPAGLYCMVIRRKFLFHQPAD